ncbi:MAG: PIN domain-containing protein [Bifidobacteriaceae bacterium]|nr:PIN domain-containing protein [Bifidobacteriaceae bacterium]
MSTAIDASVVIAWQNPDDVFHARATQMIGHATPPLHLHQLNLAEVLVGLDRSEWEDLMGALTEMGFDLVNTTGVEVAAARLDGGLRMPDACVLATAKATGATTLLTFDQRLAAAAAKAGLATDAPAEPARIGFVKDQLARFESPQDSDSSTAEDAADLVEGDPGPGS